MQYVFLIAMNSCLKAYFKRSFFIFSLLCSAAHAAMPLWTIIPVAGSNPSQTVAQNSSVTLQYQVQNQSQKAKQLAMIAIPGVNNAAACVLAPKGETGSSCVLSVTINGSALPQEGIHQGPIVCQTNADGRPNANQCYQPSAANSLNIMKGGATAAQLNVSPASLSFVVGGMGTLIVSNSSSTTAVENLAVVIPAASPIALDASSTCTVGGMLAANDSCSLVFTATAIANNISVSITGDNSNTVMAQITAVAPRPMVAVGLSRLAADGSHRPLSYYSIDGGANWALSTFSTPNTVGELRGVACDSTGLSCVAVGFAGTLALSSASSYTSTDGGKTWALAANQPPAGPGPVTIMQEAFCSVNGLHCVVAGSYFDTIQVPFSFNSVDGGQNWSSSIPPPPPAQNALTYGVSCDNSATTCAMIGQNRDAGEGLGYFSSNGGSSWNTSSMPANNSVLDSLFCAADGNSTCVAVGGLSGVPINYLSTDRGASWTAINSVTGSSRLRGVSCDETAIRCVAVGNDGDPVSFTTINSGQTWQASNSPPPVVGVAIDVQKVFCDNSGLNCTVIGWYGAESLPYTAVTSDGGNNWQPSTTLPPLPAGAESAELYVVSGQLVP